MHPYLYVSWADSDRSYFCDVWVEIDRNLFFFLLVIAYPFAFLEDFDPNLAFFWLAIDCQSSLFWVDSDRNLFVFCVAVIDLHFFLFWVDSDLSYPPFCDLEIDPCSSCEDFVRVSVVFSTSLDSNPWSCCVFPA